MALIHQQFATITPITKMMMEKYMRVMLVHFAMELA